MAFSTLPQYSVFVSLVFDIAKTIIIDQHKVTPVGLFYAHGILVLLRTCSLAVHLGSHSICNQALEGV